MSLSADDGTRKFSLEVDGNKASVDPTSTVPPGTCVKLTWLDGAGNPISSTEATAGGDPVTAPPGTEDVAVSPCDPPKDPKKKTKHMGSVPLVAQPSDSFPYRQLPFDFSDGRGRWLDFTVSASNPEQGDELAAAFRVGTLERPCPPQVTPQAFAEAELLADGRVRFTMFSTIRPAALDFRWQDAPLFTLADATVQAANGWFATSVLVPADLVEVPLPGFAAQNRASYSLETLGQPMSLDATFVVE